MRTTIDPARRGMPALVACALLLTPLSFFATPAGAAANCTITTDPSPATITEGGSVSFTGSVSGKPPATYIWTFVDGSPVNSTAESVTVSYAAEGEYTATLDGSNGRNETCTASVTVTVNAGGGGTCTRNAPTFTMGPDQSIAPDGSASYTLSVTNNDTAACADSTFSLAASDAGDTGSFDGSGLSAPSVTVQPGATNTSVSLTVTGNNTGTDGDALTTTVTASDGVHADQNDSVTTTIVAASATPVARGDTYATPVYNPNKLNPGLVVEASRVSGVLYNDFGGTPPLTAELVSPPADGTLVLNPDGSFEYTPDPTLQDNDNDSFTYRAVDDLGIPSDPATVNVQILSDQPDFKIMMSYELGMHCTGFEFAYCCVLPPYNSIVAQVAKPQATPNPDTGDDFPRLLEGSHEVGLDGLGRPTVVQAGALDNSGNFQHYMLEYFHDAQPRNEGHGKAQTSTLISDVEGNSLFYHSTIYDSALVDDIDGSITGVPGKLVTANDLGEQYEGVDGVVVGDGDFDDPTDNYANGWLNHLYIYEDLEGSNSTGSSLEADKIRLGVTGHIEYPANVGAALQPMGPTGSAAGFDNVLTFSGETGTVVYTQMKVLENLPVMLTSPDIWEALGLPLTPFEDSIDFFGDPGLVDEDSVRPFVAMKARLHAANCDQDPSSPSYGTCTQGPAIVGTNGQPVIGFGTAPIDIPNCERCHSVTDAGAVNSPSNIRSDFAMPGAGPFAGQSLAAVTDAEYQFWMAYYELVPAAGDSDWYARLKGAAINMLALHDYDQGTGFTANWPASTDTNPATNPVAQNTRLGKESVICQKCHADNVIAAVKSGTKDGNTIMPISEAIHNAHRAVSAGGSIVFNDAVGRFGGCQGCHPAHRSDGVMDGYPITKSGDNAYADGDNRLGKGGCFVGRDVHSNPLKDVDGAETPEYLNAVGQWLAANVSRNQSGEGGVVGHDDRGLWCTNCHNQFGQEMWRAEDCHDLIGGECVNDVRGLGSLSAIASAVGLGEATAIEMLDPRADPLDPTQPFPGYGADYTHEAWSEVRPDAGVATIEVDSNGDPVGTSDADGDFSVNILSFCTTEDCVSLINGNKTTDPQSAAYAQWRYPANPFIDTANSAAAVPFSAATDGRDHWLAAGEPHCADCHAAPYVEQSGNINPYPPFNYPAKAGLMRYSKGHQGISCQGCHESIHGLYPVGAAIDTTSYAQAAALNHDGSHGPLKCGACHAVNASGVPTWMKNVEYNGVRIRTFDDAVSWAHTFTREDSALTGGGACTNCHTYPKGNGPNAATIAEDNGGWLDHSFIGRIGRKVQDQAEIEALGHVAGDPDTDGDGVPDRTPQQIADTVCTACHSEKGGPSGAFMNLVSCDNATWKSHVFDGRLSEKVWEFVSHEQTGSTCGW